MPLPRVVRFSLAALCIATLLAAPLLLGRSGATLQTASTGGTGTVASAPFLALAIIGAMSGLVLLVAMRPAR